MDVAPVRVSPLTITQCLEPLLTQGRLAVVFVFGSQISGRLHAQSDLDVAVLSGQSWQGRGLAPLSVEDKWLVLDALSGLGIPVDVVDIATCGEPLLGQVLAGQRLWGSDAQVARLLLRHWADWADYYPYIERSRRERIAQWTQS